MMIDLSVDQLCRQAKSGDLEAASELLRQFYQTIYAFFRRLCGNEMEAADLTQKTFVSVWKSLAGFENRSSFSTWVHGIAWHVLLDWRRQRNPMEFPTDEWWDTCRVEGPDPGDMAAENELARQVYASVDRLKPEDKLLIHLHYYQGLSLNETAVVAGLPVSTVKYRLREAIHVLKSQLAERPLPMN